MALGPEPGRFFQELMGELQEGLRDVFRTARPVVVSPSSATGLMEAAIRNSGTGRVLALDGGRSPTVTAVEVPGGMDPKAVVKEMSQRGWVIGGGCGKVRDTTFRIGHMGDHTLAELEGLLEALSGVVGSLAPR
jgi:aspartate aminotransferase-like enzyme